jgi:hypothetical protein
MLLSGFSKFLWRGAVFFPGNASLMALITISDQFLMKKVFFSMRSCHENLQE